MEVKELQQLVVSFSQKWQRKRNYTATEEFTLIHLVEEIGELAQQYVSKQIRRDAFSDDKLNNGIADIFLQLIALAHLRGIDLEALILKTIEEDTPRVQ